MTKETERFTLRLTKELKGKLDERRKHIGISLNALVVQILWDWVKKVDLAQPEDIHIKRKR